MDTNIENAVNLFTNKSTIKQVISIDYNDFDKLVKLVTGQNFEVACDLEAYNGMSKEFSVKRKQLDDYNNRKLEEFLNTGKYSNLTCVIVQHLCNLGVIPECNLIIDIYW